MTHQVLPGMYESVLLYPALENEGGNAIIIFLLNHKLLGAHICKKKSWDLNTGHIQSQNEQSTPEA